MNKCTKCGKEFEGQFCPECGTPAAEKVFCVNCGAELAPGSEFCPSCGTKIPDKGSAEKAFCINCGKELAPGTEFCPNCGTKVPVKGGAAPTFCVNCGKEIPVGSEFCTNCGMRVDSVPPPAAPVAPVAYQPSPYSTAPGEKNTIALIGFIMLFFGFTSGIGFILCIVGLAKAKSYRPDDSYKGLALAGVIIGSVSIAIGVLSGILVSIFILSDATSIMPYILI